MIVRRLAVLLLRWCIRRCRGQRLFDSKGDVVDESVGRVGDPPGNRSRNSWRVRELVGDTVESASIDPAQSFSLTFSSGHRLTVFDDSDLYESFSIQPGDIFV